MEAAQTCDIPALVAWLGAEPRDAQTLAHVLCSTPHHKPPGGAHHPSMVLRAVLTHAAGRADIDLQGFLRIMVSGNGEEGYTRVEYKIASVVGGLRVLRAVAPGARVAITYSLKGVLTHGTPRDLAELVRRLGAARVYGTAAPRLMFTGSFVMVAAIDATNEKTFRAYAAGFRAQFPEVRGLSVEVLLKRYTRDARHRKRLLVRTRWLIREGLVTLRGLLCSPLILNPIGTFVPLESGKFARALLLDSKPPLPTRQFGFGGLEAFMLALALDPDGAWAVRRKMMAGNWWAHLNDSVADHAYGVWPDALSPCDCAGSLGRIAMLVRDRRFLGAPEAQRNRAVTYLVGGIARGVASLAQNCDCGCGAALAFLDAVFADYRGVVRAAVCRAVFEDPSSLAVSRSGHGYSNVRTRAIRATLFALSVVPLGTKFPALAWYSPRNWLIVQARRALRAVSTLQLAYFKRRNGRMLPIKATIQSAPPRKLGAYFPGGSHLMGVLDGISDRPLPPPEHATPLTLARVTARPFFATPKADGVSRVGPLPEEAVLPPGCPPLGGTPVCAEVVRLAEPRDVTVYLVFDVVPAVPGDGYESEGSESGGEDEDVFPFGLAPARLNLAQRLALLGAKPVGGVAGLAGDHEAFRDFVRGSAAPELVWVKKVVVGAALADLAKPPETPYPNDGWIVAGDRDHATQLLDGSPTLKVKPQHELTADLAYDGAVWRCAWDGGGWAKREPRPEKRRPNPPELVAFLEDCHRFPWKVEDLDALLRSTHYGLTRCTDGHTQRRVLRAWLRDAVKTARSTAPGPALLDVGCGFGGLCAGGALTGIDVDPVAIARARELRGGACRFELADAATRACPLSGKPVDLGTYDCIVCAHSIHNAARDPDTWEAWGASLASVARPGAVLAVAFVSASVFGPEGTAAADAQSPVTMGTSWARPLGPGPVPDTVLARRSFAWVKRTADEPFVTEKSVSAMLARHGWAVADTVPAPVDPLLVGGWARWAAHHRVLVFRRTAQGGGGAK